MMRFVTILLFLFGVLNAAAMVDASLNQRLEQAMDFYNKGKYQNSIEIYEGVIAAPDSNGPDGLKMVDRLIINRMIGCCHLEMENYHTALTYLLRSDSIRVATNLLYDPQAADDYQNISYCYFKIGNPEKGNQWGEKFMMNLQQNYGLASNTPAVAWKFLYRMNLICGDQAKALQYAEKILTLDSPEAIFADDCAIVVFLLQVCQLYYNLNEVPKANEIATGLEQMIAESLPNSREHLRVCNMLTVYNADNPDVAISYLEKAIDIADMMESKGDLNDDVLVTYNNVSQVLSEVDPVQALATYKELIGKCISLGKQQTDLYALALNGLAVLEGFDNPESPARFGEAFQILSENASADISHVLTVGINRLFSLDLCGRPAEEVASAAAEVTDDLKKRFSTAFHSLSEGRRELYWQQVSPWYRVILPDLAKSYDTPALWQLLYDCLLQSRGILLNSSVSLATIVKESGDPELQNLYRQYAGVDGYTEPEERDRLADALESRILKESKKYGDYMAPFAVDSKKVASCLKKGEMAIEFVRYDANAFVNTLGLDSVLYEPDVKYLALLLDSSSPAPRQVELCTEKELTDVSLGNLYNCIWKKLEPYLAGIDRIYFSPDGELFSLPVEYARMSDGRFLWERYDCRRVSSTRELARKPQSKGEGIALFGGMAFDMSIDEMEADAEKYRDITEEIVRQRGTRDELHGIAPLEGTLTEVVEICSTAEKFNNSGGSVDLFKEKDATEAAFKSISGKGKRIIHVATHGFYNSRLNDDGSAESLSADGSEEASSLAREREMLSHSGLLFAGVDNVRLDKDDIPEGVEDGVLDAYEISTLDLHGADLVALSACRTALGEVSGDGVFGLQRGLKKAGVDSILMSLWKVDDAATCEFMTVFYKNLLDPDSDVKGDKQKALARARTAVMSNPDWRDYEYWGAFILLDAVR